MIEFFNYIYYIFSDTVGVLPLIAAACAVSAVFLYKKKRRHILRHEIFVGLFLWYLFMMLYLTIPFSNLYYSIIDGRIAVRGSVNLIPFANISRMLHVGGGDAAINILGNIVMFLPLGLFLPLLWKRFDSFKETVLCGAVLSLAIEIIQSFSFRSADIDDVILNTAGVIVGFILYRLLIKIWPKINFSS